MVYHIEPILINEERYTLLVFTTTKHVVSTLSKLDRAVLISIILGFCVIILFGIYLINLYRTFHQIQNSAVKISAGNLDADIFIPHGGILYELACALNKMSKRLKSEIEDLKQFDNFRSEYNKCQRLRYRYSGIAFTAYI